MDKIRLDRIRFKETEVPGFRLAIEYGQYIRYINDPVVLTAAIQQNIHNRVGDKTGWFGSPYSPQVTEAIVRLLESIRSHETGYAALDGCTILKYVITEDNMIVFTIHEITYEMETEGQ